MSQHFAPTELGNRVEQSIYKHFVPTGLVLPTFVQGRRGADMIRRPFLSRMREEEKAVFEKRNSTSVDLSLDELRPLHRQRGAEPSPI